MSIYCRLKYIYKCVFQPVTLKHQRATQGWSCKVAFPPPSQEHHWMCTEAHWRPRDPPVDSKKGRGLVGVAYFSFWMESHSGNGCKEQNKRHSLFHHLDQGDQLNQLFHTASPVSPVNQDGQSLYIDPSHLHTYMLQSPSS